MKIRLCILGILAVFLTSGCNVWIGDSLSMSLPNGSVSGGISHVDPGLSILSGGFAHPDIPGHLALSNNIRHTKPGDTVVIELGTNDLGGLPREASVWHAVISAMLYYIPSDRCIVWVGVFNRNDPVGTTGWNTAVREELAQHPSTCKTFVDWEAMNVANESTGEPLYVESDGVHLTDLGKYVFAKEIETARITIHN